MTDRDLEYCGGVLGASMAAQRPFPLPGDKPHYARDRVIDVRHIRLEIEIDPQDKRIDGAAHTTFAPINDGVSHIEFDAVEMEVRGVRLASGASLSFTYDGEKLHIDLARHGGKAGEELTTVVEYSAHPRRGLYFIAPDEGYPDKPLQVWSQGQDEDSRHWFPCFDFPNEMQTSETLTTVPLPFYVVGNGELVSVNADQARQRRTFHYYQSKPHVAYLLSVAAADFGEVTETVDGVPVQYFAQKGREDEARRALGRTPDMLRFFGERTGVPYPYAKYAQVCVADFIFGGMENVSATTLTDTCLYDERAAPDVADNTDGLVAHELAHQWFGDLLTCRDWAHGWLNEGFATYFDELFTEHHRGVDAFRYEMRQNAQIYLGDDVRRYRRPIVNNVYNEPIDLFDRQFYEKGGWVLHMLRHTLGDDLFWKSIRHYVAKHQGGNVTTPDLQRAIEEATGRNLDQFFDEWVYGAGHPQFTLSFEWDEAAKQAKLNVKQTQSAEQDTAEVFHLPVDVDFTWEGGRQASRVQLSEREQAFYFPLPEKPKMVRFDPGGALLKTVEFKRSAETLGYHLKHDDDVLGRIDAAKEFAKLGTKDAVAALKDVVLNDAFWAVRAEAARALGSIGSAEALEALLACVGIEPSRARRGVVGALGEFRDEPPAHRGAAGAEALDRLLRDGDPSYYVEAEAAAAIGKTRSPRAFAALEHALTKPSHNNVIAMRAFEGFAELRDQRALPIAIDWSRYGLPMQARVGATSCIGRLGKLVDNKEPALDALMALLDDPDLRVRLAAVAALQELGEDRAVGALERLAARELDGRVIRRCREVAARLREGRDKGEELKKLRDEFDKLREEHKTIKDRLQKMEASAPGGDGAKSSVDGKKPAAKKTSRAPAKKPARRTSGRGRRRR
jgi:aminopeptidase N